MTTPTYTTTDVVNFAAAKDAVNVASAFDQLVGQRVYDAIQQRKIDIAQAMFEPPMEASDEQADQDDQAEQELDTTAQGEGDESNDEESNEDAEQSA